MRRLAAVFISMAIMATMFFGCSGKNVLSNIGGKTENNKTLNTEKKVENKKIIGKSKVFKAEELLSAEEVSEIIGTKVAIEPESLKMNEDTGTIVARYDYDVGSSSICALFMLKQNGAIAEDKLTDGNTAEDEYNAQLNAAGKYSESLDGFGDKAFIYTLQTQIDVLYEDYYFLCGFNGLSSDKDIDVNKAIAKKIIDNINKKK